MKHMILETERLVLRKWSPADAEAYMELYQDPEMFRWLGDGTSKPPTDAEKVRLGLQQKAADSADVDLWAVCEKASGKVVGNCGLVATPESGGIELVYHIGRAHWGKGYGTEAARACLNYGLAKLRIPRIVALVYPENRSSVRVLEKIGMRPVGTVQAYGHSLREFELTG
jgi:[ribosomal protein S5]-alanine N-acetyltransferase